MGLGDMYNIYIYICLRLSLDIYTCDYIDHDYYTHAVAFVSSMEFVLPVEIHLGSPQFFTWCFREPTHSQPHGRQIT